MSFIPKVAPKTHSTAAHSSHNFGAHQAIENGVAQNHHTSKDGGSGGALATGISAIALLFSCVSYYESSLKSADLSVYVPAMIHYARDGGDVFNVPITIANDGAKNGTVLSMTLDVENLDPKAERKTATFHGIFLGDYPRDEKAPLRSFAPLSIPGHGTFTETVRFYNMGETQPLLVTDKGDFRFTLKLATARPDGDFLDAAFRSDPKPLTFDLNLPYLAIQHLAFRNGTQAMYNKEWQSAVSKPEPSAAKQRLQESVPESPPGNASHDTSSSGSDTPPAPEGGEGEKK